MIENIKNKFICFNILFDHFFIKGNGYYAENSLVATMSKLFYHLLKYKTIRGGKQFQSEKSIFKVLEPYNFLLRYQFGYTTYDEIRNYLAMYTYKQGDNSLPNSKVIPEVISGVLSIAVMGVVRSSLNRINQIYQQIVDRDDLFYDGKALPLFDSISANVSQMADFAMGLNPRNIQLDKAMDALIQLDIESITSYERQKTVGYKLFGSISQNFRKELRFDMNQINPPARSMTVIKAAKDLQVNLERFRKNQTSLGRP